MKRILRISCWICVQAAVIGSASLAQTEPSASATSCAPMLPVLRGGYFIYPPVSDSEGNSFEVQMGAHRVVKSSAEGRTVVAGTDSPGYSGDGGPASCSQLNSPGALAVDPQGNLFVLDSGNARVRKISRSGTITTFAGNGTIGFRGDGGQAIDAQLNFPDTSYNTTIFEIDPSGNLWMSDGRPGLVREISNGIISTQPILSFHPAPHVSFDETKYSDDGSRMVTITGQAEAADSAGGINKITSVTISIDGRQVGAASYGLLRQYVYCSAYQSGDCLVGWSYEIDLSSLSRGRHTLEALATDQSQAKQSRTTSLDVLRSDLCSK